MQHLSMAPIMIVCGASLLLLQFVAPASCQRVDQLGPPDFCLAGPFHLERPHPEPQEFDECQSWEDQACCSAEVTRIINEERAVGLYNFTWDLCGTLSQECETFIKDEECFYQCEPMLGYFQIDNTGYISDIPVCGSYCDRWFEACKNDLTCVVNWLADFDYGEHGENSCPVNSTCTTFEERYGDARGLCNTMWGDAFFYSEIEDNCTVMSFTGPNPNLQLTFPVPDTTGSNGGTLGMTGSLFMISMGVFASI